MSEQSGPDLVIEQETISTETAYTAMEVEMTGEFLC